MPSLNEVLQDAAITHAIDISRYTNSVVRKMIGVLNRSDADLFAQIVAALDRMPAESFTVTRLDALLIDVRRINAAAYATMMGELGNELRDFAQYETGYQATLFKAALPIQVSFAAVSVDQVYSAAMARPFQGRLLKEFGASIESDKMIRIRDALRIGYVEGETIQQMITRIRGTKSNKYTDGIIEIDRRNAASVVRTAISHMGNYSRQKTYEANADIIKGVKWVSAIDGRTSAVCRARDGAVYPLNSGPRPPAHWNCRSLVVPITRSFRELGIGMDDFSPVTRSSMDGQIPGDTTYQTWLKGKPAAYQDEILGKAKGALFRRGDLTLDRFVDRTGKEFTLDELRKRNADAFKKAGL